MKNAIAIGNSANVGAFNSLALGNNSEANTYNSVALGANSKTSTAIATQNMTIAGQTYNVAGVKPSGTVSVGDVDKERTITNVAAGRVSSTSTDAVNGSQLYAANEAIQQNADNIAKGINNVTNLSNRMNRMDKDMKQGDALNAALSALKPIQYDPMEPNQFMAGFGNYRNTRAAAVGFARYFNESTMAHFGVALGGDNGAMANVGVTFKYGSGAKTRPNQYAKGPISSIYVLQDEVAQLQAENAELKEKLNMILSKLS